MKMGMISCYLPRFDADVWFDVVEVERPLAVFLVPAMVQLLLVHPRFETTDLSFVQICSVGSAPLSPSAVDRLQTKMPDALVSNNYGMTEAGSVYCLMPKGEAVRRPGSVGKPAPPAEVRCIDDDGVEVPAGELGRIELHIPGRPREYLDDPEATTATWVDGWLRTGDIGKLDEDGYLYISGRAKDVIIRGGHNIHAVDVENVIATHPDVAEVAVVGVAHEVLGEDLVAVVVPRPGVAPDPESLRAHALDELAAYKVPRRWEFTDHLPRNSAGKILKNQLRDGLGDPAAGVGLNEDSSRAGPAGAGQTTKPQSRLPSSGWLGIPTGWRCWPRTSWKWSATSVGGPTAVTPHGGDLPRGLEQRVGVARSSEHLAVHEGGLLGGQEGDERGVEGRVLALWRLTLEEPLGHPGGAGGGHGIDGDPVLAQLHRPHEGHTHDGRLGRAVIGLAEVAPQAGRRRHVDDPAVARLLHVRGGVASHVERALLVDGHHRVEVGLVHLEERPVADDAGVVDHDVDAPEGVHRGGDDAPGGLEVGDRVVADGGDAALRFDLLHHRWWRDPRRRQIHGRRTKRRCR